MIEFNHNNCSNDNKAFQGKQGNAPGKIEYIEGLNKLGMAEAIESLTKGYSISYNEAFFRWILSQDLAHVEDFFQLPDNETG